MIAMSGSLQALLSALILAVALQKTAAYCPMEVSTPAANNECICENGNMFNYRDLVCEDADVNSIYIITENGPNAKVETSDVVCEAGWETNNDGLCLSDVDECSTAVCGTKEMCQETPGGHKCVCNNKTYNQLQYCQPLDESKNPQWHDCPQYAYDHSDGFRCKCFSRDHYNNTADDGRHCELYDGFKNCTESEPSNNVMCITDEETNINILFPLPGFAVNGADIDECFNKGIDDTHCQTNSKCINDDGNIEGSQAGYHCQSLPGYITTDFEHQSISRTCMAGSELDCEDLCEQEVQSEGKFCRLIGMRHSNRKPMIVESLTDNISSKSITVSHITGSMVVRSYEPVTEASLVYSLELILGSNVVEASTSDGYNFGLSIISDEKSSRIYGMTPENIAQLITISCLDMKDTKNSTKFCRLPEGVVAETETIKFQYANACDGASLCASSHNCEDLYNGRYKCTCKEYGTEEYFQEYLQICSTNVVDSSEGAVIGLSISLAVAILCVIGLVVKIVIDSKNN